MFERGRTYRRRDLHTRFGGQQQGGISTPSSHPLIFAFTGDTGELYGYQDGCDSDGTFRYSGEGQLGDMAFVRGNRSLLDHAANGRDIHLFERTSKAFVRYLGQMVCAGYDFVPEVPDRNGKPRTVIIFHPAPPDQGSWIAAATRRTLIMLGPKSGGRSVALMLDGFTYHPSHN